MKQEPPKGNDAADGSPLKTTDPKVACFNRRAVFVIAVVASSVVAFALVAALSPKKKVQGEERAAITGKYQPGPDLPDPIVSSPATYQELQLAKGRKAPPQEAPGVLGKLAEPERATAETSVSPVLPEEQAEGKEQAEKDAVTAMNSQVGFEMRDTPQGKLEQPARQEFVLPGAPPGRPQTAGLAGPDGMGADQNMQDEKRTFSTPREVDFPYLKATLASPMSPYEIKAGSVLPAVLITGINSDLPGQLVAQIRESVYDTVSGNHLLIPQGTRLIGAYDSKIAFGQERVLVVWTRLIMPNGNSLNLEGTPGADLSGYAGVSGKVNNHYGKLIAGVVLGSIIGAGAQVATGGQGSPNVPPSFEQLAVSGAAQNINQAGQAITQKNLNRQPTIEVSPGDKINVFVTKDMILQPYTE